MTDATPCYAMLDRTGCITQYGKAQQGVPFETWLKRMNAVEITSEQYATVHVGGVWKLLDGKLQDATPEPSIDVVRDQAKRQIDTAAEIQRGKIRVPGAGQALEYERVHAEAEAVMAAYDPLDASRYPWLVAGRDKVDLRSEAAAVLGAVRACDTACLAIRCTRMRTKAALDAASTVDAIQAVMAALRWP